MKRIFFNTILFLLFPLLTTANLVLEENEEYMITCYDTGKGGVEQAKEGVFPLIYNSSASVDSDGAFWFIKEETPGQYSFKNAYTNQYLTSVLENRDQKYIAMTDALEGENSLFAINQRGKDGKTYYAVNSVANPDHYFNKRTDGSFGTYSGDNGNTNNELFTFRKRNEVFEGGTGVLYNYLNTLTFNEKEIIASNDGEYYFSVAYKPEETDLIMLVNYEAKSSDYIVKINDREIVNGEGFTFENVTATTGHKIDILQENKIIASEKIIITSLPIVQLYSEGNNLSSIFSSGKIRVNEGSKTSSETGELLHAHLRYRGSSALGQSKKAFAIKLKDANGQKVDRSFFGLRNDNYWILDAMAVDKARMRNRVATDLWNDFASDPHYKDREKNMINGTRGQFVEVFLDNEYWGLYCMTERIDRKQLKLKKFEEATRSIRGVLYKSTGWSYATLMGYVPRNGPDPNYYLPDFYNSSGSWQSYDIKYPDFEDGEPIDWEPLYNSVVLAAKSTQNQFTANVDDYFDLPVWTDYYLFIELLLATDNHGKNAYFSIYDINQSEKLLITPWDLDGTFGRVWNASEVQAELNFTNYIVQNENGEHNLFRRLKADNILGFNDLLKTRYDELRFSWFSEESLMDRFESYMRMFEESGAAYRETNRWWGIDLNSEMDYLDQWIRKRVAFLNDQYGEPDPDPDPSGMDSVDYVFKVYPNPVRDILYISEAIPGTGIYIYTESGVMIYRSEVVSSSMTIDFSRFAAGRYLLKMGDKRKVIIRNP